MVNFLWENIFKSSDQKSISAILKDNFLFQDLTSSELRFVEQIIHFRKYQPGESVFRQGELGIGMYIILRGSISISIEDFTTGEEESKKILVTRLGEGDFFGELSLVENNSRRTATAKANDISHLIGFFKPDLLEIAERNPSTGNKIIMRLSEVLGARLKETTDRVTQLRKELKNLKKE